MRRIPKPKVRVVDAAFNSESYIICPHCFSRPSLAGQRDMQLSGKRGWGVQIEAEPLMIKRQPHAVAVFQYPCANSACHTHLVVRSLVMFLGSTEAKAPFVAKQMLKGRKLDQYLRGETGKDGVWREDGVPLVVAPPAPPPRKPAPEKKAPVTKKKKKARSPLTSRKKAKK